MTTGLTDDERDRLVRVETRLQEVRREVDGLRNDFRNSISELHGVVQELRMAIAMQSRDNSSALARPMDRVTGMKYALVGLGGIIVFFVTVLGGVLGAVSFFRGH